MFSKIGDAEVDGLSLGREPPKAGDAELMGGHTAPPPAAKAFAPAAEQRARSVREAQQADLARKTGDTLYPSAGALGSCKC